MLALSGGCVLSASTAALAKNGRKRQLRRPRAPRTSALARCAQRGDAGDVDLDDGGELRRDLQRLDHPLGDDLAQPRHLLGAAAQRCGRRRRGRGRRRAWRPARPPAWRGGGCGRRCGGCRCAAALGGLEHVLLADAAADAGAGDGRQVDAVLGGELADERRDVARRRSSRPARRGGGAAVQVRVRAAAGAAPAAPGVRRGGRRVRASRWRRDSAVPGGTALATLVPRVPGRAAGAAAALTDRARARRRPATVSSSATSIDSRMPATGEGISVSTLSVETSSSGSSAATGSPTDLSQRVTVPSVTLSPSAGSVTSVAPGRPARVQPRRSARRSPPELGGAGSGLGLGRGHVGDRLGCGLGGRAPPAHRRRPASADDGELAADEDDRRPPPRRCGSGRRRRGWGSRCRPCRWRPRAAARRPARCRPPASASG